MEILSKEEFSKLAGLRHKHCVTIYIPTHSSGVEVNEKYDLIVFKNNVQKARIELTSRGLDGREVDKLLSPATELVMDEEFWNRQQEGLAVFISHDLFQVYQTPFTLKEEMYINESFFMTPLLPLIERRHRFFLLVFSKKDCKFYEGDQFGMKKLEVEGLPYGIDDVVRFEEKEGRQLHRRAGAGAGRSAKAGASFHGHGTGFSDEDEYVLQYLKEVDQTLWKEVLHNQHIPLVLAAVDFEIALYRQVSNYKYLWEESLTGNFEHEDRNTLFLKVKEKLGSYFKKYVNEALKNFYDHSTTELSSSIPEEVVPAAYYAQVSDLFIEKDQRIWGSFDEQDNKIEIHERKQSGDDCLINNAIIKTLLNGGEVHLLDKQKMPAESKIAAFLRFSA
jgi:hypothetical protein